MARFLLIVIAFLNIPLSGFSQNWTWDSIISEGLQLKKDNFQHVYGYNQHLIQKYTANGSLIWQQNVPSNMHIEKLCCSPDSSFYVCGTFQGNLTLNFFTLNNKGLQDIFLARYSGNGNLLWVISMGSKRDEFAGAVNMNGSDLIFTGTAGDTLSYGNQSFPKNVGYEMFIAKIFSNGTLDTLRYANGNQSLYTSTYGTEIVADKQGEFAMVMYLDGQVQVDTFNFQNFSGSGYLLKFTQNLQLTWSSPPFGYHMGAHNLMIGQQNDIIYTWSYGNQYGQVSGGIKRYTSNGTSAASYYSVGGSISSLDLDSCNNIYFTGEQHPGSTIYFPKKYYLISGQLSPTGNLNWIRKDSTQINLWKIGSGIAAVSVNKCLVSGHFADSLNLKNLLVDTVQGLYTSNYFLASLQATFGIPVNVTPPPNLTICSNKNTTLTCNTGGAINWYASLQSITPLHSGSSFITPLLSPGNYTYYAEATTCTLTSGRLPVTVSVNALPNITAADGTICAGEFFQLNGSGGLNYFYPSNNPLVLPSSSTSYTLSGSDANGCVNTGSCFVTVKPVPTLSITTSQNTICAGQAATINCTGAQSYSWNTGAISPNIIVSPVNNTGYVVTGFGLNGCSAVAMLTQRVADCTGLLEEQKLIGFNLYPNPSNGLMTLQMSVPTRVIIFNALGSKVFENNFHEGSHSLDLRTLKKGIYFLEYKFAGKSELKKLIIE